ncbi:hypothetical protein EMCRGX_G008365 [Ephydatia muelleri]
MTVPCRPAIKVESYVPLAQDEVQHWVPGLTTEDKKMITSGMWLSDQIVDAGQKLLKSTYPNIQGLQEAALAHTSILADDEEYLELKVTTVSKVKVPRPTVLLKTMLRVERGKRYINQPLVVTTDNIRASAQT